MSILTEIAVVVALLGSAIIGGTFFAFSNFVMQGLARLPSHEGIAAMQSINVTVLNRSFLGAFTGTAALSLLVAVLTVKDWEMAVSPFYLSASLLYFIGTFLVTGLGNVPLNNRLASLEPSDKAAAPLWEHYLKRWTLLNSVRTGAAVMAVLLFILGLIQRGGV